MPRGQRASADSSYKISYDANYAAAQTPQLRVLSDKQIEKIYHATLECLWRTGVSVLSPEARDLLAEAGSRVDGEIVRIPPHVIQDAVASTPRSFTIWGRDPQYKMQVAVDRVYFGPGPTCTYFVDPKTGQRRHTRRGDPGLTALVCDALPHIDYVMSLGLISDVRADLAPVVEFAEMITNSGKPILPWAYHWQNVEDIYQIALAVAGGEEAFRLRPNMGLFTTYQSPLRHSDEVAGSLIWAAQHDIPIIHIGGGCAGTTAPITGAGLMVIYLAGALSGLAIIQLAKRGTRTCIGGVPEPMTLSSGAPSYGAPETSLYSAAMADISRWLGLPFMGTAGASESKLVDLQAAIESTIQVVFSALSGATLVHDVGFLDCADIGSLEMLVMNDEIIAMTRRIMRGMDVSDETLMLDLIDQVGPGGEFISTPETARLCRTEIWHPTLMDRERYDTWAERGAKSMNARIQEKLAGILATHTPPPLPEGVSAQIQTILANAEARGQSIGGG